MIRRENLGHRLVQLSIALIILGFFMLVQPFLMAAYTFSFGTILTGVVLFNIASHL